MANTDTIADLLTRVRNALEAGHEDVAIPASRLKISIAHILKAEGFIHQYRCFRDSKQGILKMGLKYTQEGRPAISELKRISKPSRRIYVKATEIPFVKKGFGVSILSTSQGVMADRDARKLGLGGEIICSVF